MCSIQGMVSPAELSDLKSVYSSHTHEGLVQGKNVETRGMKGFSSSTNKLTPVMLPNYYMQWSSICW